MPRVTVLMPTYNVAPYVKEAIESVLRQTYVDFELLVIDDCSKDNTVDIVKSISDKRIRIVQNEYNLGLADNLNRGLDLIETELVARMDGDDIAETFWLEHEVAILDKYPDVGICSGGFERFGTQHSIVRFPETPESGMVNMLFGCSVIVPVFRRNIYIENKLHYKKSAFPAEDYRFWAECLRHTKLYNLQETVFRYRMHETQICTSMKSIQLGKADEVRLYMLEWLYPNFDEREKEYFLNHFVSGNIDSKRVLIEMNKFAKMLIERNREILHFSEEALINHFKEHIILRLYNSIISIFFERGYSVGRYLQYLKSGLALKTTYKYEVRFLIKSLLRRNK